MELRTTDKHIELYDIEGNFLASWGIDNILLKYETHLYIRQRAIKHMLDEAFNAGKRARSKEIRKLLDI